MTVAGLDLALHTLAFEWTTRPEGFDGSDVVAHLDALQQEAAEVALADLNLVVIYPRLVRLAALALTAVAALPPAPEIDGLDCYEGLWEWLATVRAIGDE